MLAESIVAGCRSLFAILLALYSLDEPESADDPSDWISLGIGGVVRVEVAESRELQLSPYLSSLPGPSTCKGLQVGGRCRVLLTEMRPQALIVESDTCDPYVIVRNQQNEVLAENDDGENAPYSHIDISELCMAPTFDGRLLIEVVAIDNVPGSVALRVCDPLDASTSHLANDLAKRGRIIDNTFPTLSPHRARALCTLGRLLYASGDCLGGIEKMSEATEVWSCIGESSSYEHLIRLRELASMALESNQLHVANCAIDALLNSSVAVDIVGSKQLVVAYSIKSHAAYYQGRLRESLSACEAAIRLSEADPSFDAAERSVLAFMRAACLCRLGKSEEGTRVLEHIERLYGILMTLDWKVDQMVLIRALQCHAAVSSWEGDCEVACRHLRLAIVIAQCCFGERSNVVCSLRQNWILTLLNAKRNIESRRECARLFTDEKQLRDHTHPLVMRTAVYSALASARLGEMRDARDRLAGIGCFMTAYQQYALTCDEWVLIAETIAERGDHRAAVCLFRALLSNGHVEERSSTYHSALAGLCENLVKCNEYSQALSIAIQIADLYPYGHYIGSHTRWITDQLILARCLMLNGKLAASVDTLDKVLAGWSVDDRDGTTVSVILGVTDVLLQLGDAERACQLLELSSGECFDVEASNAMAMSEISYRLATTLLASGRISAADHFIGRALSISLGSGGTNSNGVAKILGAAAVIKRELGDASESDKLIDRAWKSLEVRESNCGASHNNVAICAAIIAAESEQWWLVLPLCEQLLAGLPGTMSTDIDALTSVSCVMTRAGYYDSAWDVACRAWACAAGIIRGEEGPYSEYERMMASSRIRRCIGQLMAVAVSAGQQDRLEVVYSAVKVWKGWVFRTIGGERRRAFSSSCQSLGNVNELYREGVGVESCEGMAGDSSDGARDCCASRIVGSGRHLQVSDGESMEATVLSFLAVDGSSDRVRESIYAWIKRPDCGSVSCVSLGSREVVEAAVDEYVNEIRARDRRIVAGLAAAEDVGAGSDLRSVLWVPIEKYVDGASTLVISADGALAEFPFECLRLSDGSYLAERVNIVYSQDVLECVSDARDPTLVSGVIVNCADTVPFERVLAGVQASSSSTQWASEECDTVEMQLRSADPRMSIKRLVGHEATERALREELSRSNVIHIAAHGFSRSRAIVRACRLSELNDERAGSLVELLRGTQIYPGTLAGIAISESVHPDSTGDGGLTAEEVSWLDLSKCSLAVLSGCGTALGAVVGGEGLVGLRRAFRMAGAKTVVSSLWEVPDRATAELMGEFYKNLFDKKMGRAAALRAAKLEILRRNRTEFGGEGLPSTWAGFVIDGAWN